MQGAIKHAVKVRLESCQLDPEGQAARTENTYDGIWYHHQQADYLVYHEPEVQTTLRWGDEEWRLFRRGADLEGWQVFRLGERASSDLRLQGSLLPLDTHTQRMQVRDLPSGKELYLEYTLYSGTELLGSFSLIIQMTIQEDVHGQP